MPASVVPDTELEPSNLDRRSDSSPQNSDLTGPSLADKFNIHECTGGENIGGLRDSRIIRRRRDRARCCPERGLPLKAANMMISDADL